MKELRHAMIDLETLDLIPTAKIVSIGAAIFDPRYNAIGDRFYAELAYKAQKDRTHNADTVSWWKRQSAECRKQLQGKTPLKSALIDLKSFLPNDCKVWGCGPTFDISILEDAYRSFEIEVPWKFWNVRDVRTIRDIYENSRGGWGKSAGVVTHNAMEDAQRQAEEVNKLWKKILEIRK